MNNKTETGESRTPRRRKRAGVLAAAIILMAAAVALPAPRAAGADEPDGDNGQGYVGFIDKHDNCSRYAITADENGKIIAALPSMIKNCDGIDLVVPGQGVDINDETRSKSIERIKYLKKDFIDKISFLDDSVASTPKPPTDLRISTTGRMEANQIPGVKKSGYKSFWITEGSDQANIVNRGIIPFGPNTKIITIDANGNELLPRPPLDEDDDIFVAIVNLSQQDIEDHRFMLLAEAEDFDELHQRIKELPSGEKISYAHSASELAGSCEIESKNHEFGQSSPYNTVLLYLGNMQGQAPVGSGGLGVKFEILYCDPGKGDWCQCNYFAGDYLLPMKKEASDVTDGNDLIDVDIDIDIDVSPKTGDTSKEPSNAASPIKLRSGSMLNIYNIYRFRMTAGYAYSWHGLADSEDIPPLSPVIGVAAYLGDKRNPTEPPERWSLDRTSLWLGMAMDQAAFDSTYLGLSYEIVDGADIMVGCHFQVFEEHKDHDPDRATYEDMETAFYMGMAYDLSIFRNSLEWMKTNRDLLNPPAGPGNANPDSGGNGASE